MARPSWSASCAPPSTSRADHRACRSGGCEKNSRDAEAQGCAGNQADELRAYLLPIAVVLFGAPSAARASCAIELEGDPDVIARIHDPLLAFGDDSVTCVDVRVLCSRDVDDIVLDLRDQLGRSVQRRFVTPDGAAAFLISWSRRPLPHAGTGLEPSAPPIAVSNAAAPPRPAPPPPRVATAAPPPSMQAEAPDDASLPSLRGLAPEVRTAYIAAPFGSPSLDGLAGVVEVAALFQHGAWRYGANARAITASVSQDHFLQEASRVEWVGLDVEGVFGSRWRINRILLGGEVFVGGGATIVGSQQGMVDAPSLGLRGGARIAIASHVLSRMWVEGRLAWDGLRQLGQTAEQDTVLRPDRYLGDVHLEIGLLWRL